MERNSMWFLVRTNDWGNNRFCHAGDLVIRRIFMKTMLSIFVLLMSVLLVSCDVKTSTKDLKEITSSITNKYEKNGHHFVEIKKVSNFKTIEVKNKMIWDKTNVSDSITLRFKNGHPEYVMLLNGKPTYSELNGTIIKKFSDEHGFY
jgi:hypothetical protein